MPDSDSASDPLARSAIEVSRRSALISLAGLPWLASGWQPPKRQPTEDRWDDVIDRGLSWLASQQARPGNWPAKTYPVAVAALAGTALLCSGSTTTQGPFASQIRLTVDFLLSQRQPTGLIGDPQRDSRYTYGHGFSMLFLSQILGEEEDVDRREELIAVLEKSIEFSVNAQTDAGGWGYVSAKSSSFDEGSTTITQVQGLRGCRNAGLVVPKSAVDAALKYIYDCQNPDGGISYSSKSLGTSRPAITAAALAALYNAGEYDSERGPRMWDFCKQHLHDLNQPQYGHWHYTYLYYSQVVYRQGPTEWAPYRDRLCRRIQTEQLSDGSWKANNVGAAYVAAMNLIMMQLDYGFLPIYQR